MAESRVDDIKQAKALLAAGSTLPTPAEIVALATRLTGNACFGLARRVLSRVQDARVIEPAMRARISRLHALAISRDVDLPAESRFQAALEVLGEVEDLRGSEDQELLSAAADILKYRWCLFGETSDLEMAAQYYERACRLGIQLDGGHSAVNAALALDLLAWQESGGGSAGPLPSTDPRRERARRLREDVVEQLNQLEHAGWQAALSLWQAYFGLGRFDDARLLGKSPAMAGVTPGERETSVREMALLARCQAGGVPIEEQGDDCPAFRPLAEFLGADDDVLRSVLRGRIGLVLWGGGFRSAFFHIGVLARLAEAGMLRDVEYLSCASGGAVVGTLYYLEVRRLLQTKGDAEITAADYVALVERLERKFLAAVQHNIRTRAFAAFRANLKSTFVRDYTLTDYLGELYEELVFAAVEDGEGASPRYLSGLFIQPKGESEDFRPEQHNAFRRNKVPVLTLNATSLNTGGNWQFTVAWMGEPQEQVNADLGGATRLRRVHYVDAPERYRKIRLGWAVAACCSPPGLFEPVALPDLYQDGYLIRLTSSVYNKHGMHGLLERGCTYLIVSDGSSQLEPRPKPWRGIVGVSARLSQIMFGRVRDAQLQELLARRRSPLLRRAILVHLRKGLDVHPIDWLGYPYPEEGCPGGAHAAPLTPYGIRKDVQERLARLRSDIDSFCDLEAFPLMTSGYRMIDYELGKNGRGAALRGDWRFLVVEESMTRLGYNAVFDRLVQVLDAGRFSAFRIWRLSPALLIFSYLVLAVAAIALMLGLGRAAYDFSIRPMQVAWYLDVAVLVLVFFWMLTRKPATQFLVSLFMTVIGWAAARFHLLVFDRLYLSWGRLKRSAPTTLVDRLTRPAPAEAINRLIDRSQWIHELAGIFTAAGFRVERLRGIAELAATREGRQTLVVVKTPANTEGAVDWKTGSALQMALWTRAEQLNMDPDALEGLLVLVDVRSDASLDAFLASAPIRAISLTGSELSHAGERAAELTGLPAAQAQSTRGASHA